MSKLWKSLLEETTESAWRKALLSALWTDRRALDHKVSLPDLKSPCSLLGACLVTERREPLEFLLRVVDSQHEHLRLLLPTPSKRWEFDEVIEYKFFKGPLLHFAVTKATLEHGTFDMVATLFQHGADPLIKDSRGRTAEHAAQSRFLALKCFHRGPRGGRGSFEQEAEIELMEAIIELLERAGRRVVEGPAVGETRRPQGDLSFLRTPESPLRPDFVVKAGGKVFHCHKELVGKRCAYFKALLGNGMSESQAGEVTLEDVNAVAMEWLLSSIYRGEVAVLPEPQEGEEPYALPLVLLRAADRLGLGDIFEDLQRLVMEFVDSSNVLTIYADAKDHDATALVTRCRCYVKSHMDRVIRTLPDRERDEGQAAVFVECMKPPESLFPRRRRRGRGGLCRVRLRKRPRLRLVPASAPSSEEDGEAEGKEEGEEDGEEGGEEEGEENGEEDGEEEGEEEGEEGGDSVVVVESTAEQAESTASTA